MKAGRAYVVGMGANLGARAATMRAALEFLAATDGIELGAASLAYESEPLRPPQPAYLNFAVRIETELAPDALWTHLVRIETTLGRVRTERWGSRTIDLDILWCNQSVHGQAVEVPHPELERRWFALGPLLEVAPEAHARYAPVLAALGGVPRPGAALETLAGLAFSPEITDS